MPPVTESTYNDNDTGSGTPAVFATLAQASDAAYSQRWAQIESHHAAIWADLETDAWETYRAELAAQRSNPFGWSREQLAQFLSAYRRRSAEWIPKAEARNAARAELADYLEATVLPAVDWERQHRIKLLIDRLRLARGWAELQYSQLEDRWLSKWETKADLPLLCPDDSNEEFKRLQNRYLERMLEWAEAGGRIYTLVLTAPLVAPGDLHTAMRERMHQARDLVQALELPGAMLVMECPLSAHRRWHVHVNCILLSDRYLQYDDVHRHWRRITAQAGTPVHRDLKLELLGQQADGSYRPLTEIRGRELLEGALRELIKYAVRTVADKSTDAQKQAEALAEGRALAPAMTDYSATEWLEWWEAHRKFRRTRTYGVLYKVGKPPKQDLDGFKHVGFVQRVAGSYVLRSTLLNSIQWDNFFSDRTGNPSEPSRGSDLRARGPPD